MVLVIFKIMKNKNGNGNEKVCLGDKVRCKYTGYEGIAVARTEFLNGCIQISVAPRFNKKNPSADMMLQEMGIDEQSLVIIDTKLRKISKAQKKENDEMLDSLEENDYETGGPSRKSMRQRGY